MAGGLVGWVVDSATGSDNEYETPANITLVPDDTRWTKSRDKTSDDDR